MLALAIGANIANYSIAKAVIFLPLSQNRTVWFSSSS
jgi:hypothetical protein